MPASSRRCWRASAARTSPGLTDRLITNMEIGARQRSAERRDGSSAAR
jgi:hypothetical protein